MNKQVILVTGATGFLGRRLLDCLEHSNYDVIAVGRRQNPGLPAVKYLCGDIVRSKILAEIKSPIRFIVHLAADVHGCVGSGCMIDNVYSVIALARYAAAWQTKRLIFTSTSGVYDTSYTDKQIVKEDYPIKPSSLYALTKYLAEESLRTSGISYTILRMTYLYGAGSSKTTLDRLIKNAKLGRSLHIRDEYRDYLHVDEAARAIINALAYEGNESVFNIGSGKFTHMRTIAEKIIALSNNNLPCYLAGNKNNIVLDCSRAQKELSWTQSRDILDDISEILSLTME